MEKQHIDVVIATPGSNFTSAYLKSLLPTLEKISREKISWAFVNEQSSHVADAREKTISGSAVNDASQQIPFNDSITYNKIIWIDSDISWEVEDFMKLYESDKDIIAGAYLQPDGAVPAYKDVMGPPMSYEEVLKLDEPVEVSAVGFGFVAIKSGIFESMTRPWFQSAEVSEVKNEKEYKYNILGEDLSWCYRAKELNNKIWFDPSIRVTHHKTMKLTWEGPR
jgi:hypothetical protein